MFADDGYVSIHLMGLLLLLAFVVNAALLGWIVWKVRRKGWGTTRSERQHRIGVAVTGSILCIGLVTAAFYLYCFFV